MSESMSYYPADNNYGRLGPGWVDHGYYQPQMLSSMSTMMAVQSQYELHNTTGMGRGTRALNTATYTAQNYDPFPTTAASTSHQTGSETMTRVFQIELNEREKDHDCEDKGYDVRRRHPCSICGNRCVLDDISDHPS